MKKNRFHIVVAVLAGMLFITVTVAHACAGTAALQIAHDHSGILAAGSVQSSHSAAPEAGCRSIRDRLLSLGAERSAHATLLTSGFHTMPTLVGRQSTEIDTLPAEGPPGCAGTPVAPERLYFSKSILRI